MCTDADHKNRMLIAPAGRHEAYFRSKDKQTIPFSSGDDVVLEKDELLNIEWSYKAR